MENLLLYFAYNTGLAFAGVLILLTVQNLQPIGTPTLRFKHVVMAVVLSIFFTPIFALGVSAVLKLRSAV